MADQPIGCRLGVRVAIAGDLFILSGIGERFMYGHRAGREKPQAVKRPLLIVEVREFLRECQCPHQRLARGRNHSSRINQRHAKMALQDHLIARSGVIANQCRRLAGPLAGFGDLRHRDPEIRRVCGKRESQCSVALWRQRPVQRRTEIVDLAAIGAEVVDRRLKPVLGRERREQRQAEIRLPLDGIRGFATFVELLERIRAGCLKQSPSAHRSPFVHRKERFCDQARNAVEYDLTSPFMGFDRLGGLESKSARKDRQMAQQSLLFRQQ